LNFNTNYIDFYFNYLRWNSSYLAWDRLIYLQCAILQLNVNLSCSFIREEKADGAKLKKVILNDNEWELLDNLHEENYDSDGTIGSDDSEDIEEISADQINYNDIAEILESVKRNIYMGLKHYWKIPNEFGIMAALLDPRYKNLNFISDDNVKQRIHSTLRAQYDQLKWEISQQSIPSSPTTITTTDAVSLITESSTTAGSLTPSRSLREHKARHEQKTKKYFK